MRPVRASAGRYSARRPGAPVVPAPAIRMVAVPSPEPLLRAASDSAMADLRPFRAYRPPVALARAVASPPYDVLDSDEARAMADGNPHAFLHVTKPEIDLPVGTDLYADEVYAKGAANLAEFIRQGTLVRDPSPCFYVYRQRMGSHVQTGLVAGASVQEYDDGRIKKHEKTRQDKEDDRTRHQLALGAQTGPVFLTYPQRADIDAIVAEICSAAPDADFVADDGIGHTLWVVAEPSRIDAIRAAFASIPALYVADGHHRSAAASRVRAARHAEQPNAGPDAPWEHFLSVTFPHDQMQILDYNRVVLDLAGKSQDAFLAEVAAAFEVEPCGECKPSEPRTFTMCLAGSWYRLRARPGSFPADHPVDSLDVSILQDNLLSPVLGIGDPRKDKRIDFVGGIRGTAELARRVAKGAAVAFALYPTSMAQLMAIADAGEIMPPKSTWFEPKLRSGLFVRSITEL